MILKRGIDGICCLMALAMCASGQNAESDTVEVVGIGAAAVMADMAAAEEEAVWDAKRNAVEQAAGILLRARAIGRDFQLAEDEIESRTNGFIRKWKVIPGSRKIESLGAGRVLRLQVQATVALLPVIRKLSDIKDVYEDLERPRMRVQILGDVGRRAADCLIAALKAEGFEISRDERSEILVAGVLNVTPTLKLGADGSPYGVGEKMAACRARLTLQMISSSSEEVLMTLAAQGSGRSFTTDDDARAESVESAADNLIVASWNQIRENLLVKWARERQEGHIVAVCAHALDSPSRDWMRQKLAAMRGFRRFVSEGANREKYTFRILTRLDSRGIRRRLEGLNLNNRQLAVLNQRGPTIECAFRSTQRAAGK